MIDREEVKATALGVGAGIVLAVLGLQVISVLMQVAITLAQFALSKLGVVVMP